MRPLEEFQRRLRDEHVLMDPIRERAALIVLQEGRVQKAIRLEQQLEGVVLPAVRAEIEALARLWDGYEAALERLGLGRRPDSQLAAAPAVQQTVNIYEILADQVAILPPEQRQQLADVLDNIRETRARARMAEVEARVRASLPLGLQGAASGACETRPRGSMLVSKVFPIRSTSAFRISKLSSGSVMPYVCRPSSGSSGIVSPGGCNSGADKQITHSRVFHHGGKNRHGEGGPGPIRGIPPTCRDAPPACLDSIPG